jgi:hypothetical protein
MDVAYDGIDQDCSGGDLVDVDADGWDAEIVGGADCDDSDPAVNPAVDEVAYDGLDNDCVGGDLVDEDGDGYDATEAGGDDCDDTNAHVHPGAVDGCGGGDQDCDGSEDEDADADADGYSTCDGDCDDADAAINPGASEVYGDGIDEDCSGVAGGDCDPSYYEDYFWVALITHFDFCDSSEGVGDDTCYLLGPIPEDAVCSGTEASWTGAVACSTGTVLEGEFHYDFDTGCASVPAGSGTYGGHLCERAYAESACN